MKLEKIDNTTIKFITILSNALNTSIEQHVLDMGH